MPITPPAIGDLRYPVLVIRRQPVPADGVHEGEDNQLTHTARAAIEPSGPTAFYNSQVMGQPFAFTHRIRIRYIAGLDRETEIVRTRRLADGSIETEQYSVLRVNYLQGQQRFVDLECSLINRTVEPC